MNQPQADLVKAFAAYGQQIVNEFQAVCKLSEDQAIAILDLQAQLEAKKAVEVRNVNLLESLRAKEAELADVKAALARFEPEMIKAQAAAARQKSAQLAAQADELEKKAAERAKPAEPENPPQPEA